MTLAPSHLPPPPAPARRRGVGDGGTPDDPGSRALAAQVALLRSLCGPGRPSLLHVGCGTGQVLLGLAPDLALGIGVAPDVEDVYRARLAGARQGLGRLHFTVGTAVAFRVDQVLPQAFDLVLVEAIGGLRGLSRDLGGALRRLAPGGRIVVVGTDDSHPAVAWRRWCRGEKPPPGLTPQGAREAARRLGLEPVSDHSLPWEPEPVPEQPAGSRLKRALGRMTPPPRAGAFALVLRRPG